MQSRRSLLLLALTLAVCFSLCVKVRAQGTALFVVPTDGAPAKPVQPGEPLPVALYARELTRLADALGLPAPAAGAERLEYAVAAYPQLPADKGRTWLESTFVVDFEERDTQRALEELIKAKGQRPSRAQLIEFASTTLKPTLGRGFDIASVVARRREGDCTEFAVLTAALARATRVPARVVLGLALISSSKGTYSSYGHAWTEVLEDGRWVVADAALYGLPEEVRYIPYGVLSDEGPGYSLNIARLTNAWIQRVTILSPDVFNSGTDQDRPQLIRANQVHVSRNVVGELIGVCPRN
jgi:hypothetical protein